MMKDAGEFIEIVIMVVIAVAMIDPLQSSINTATANASPTVTTILSLIITIFVLGLVWYVAKKFFK